MRNKVVAVDIATKAKNPLQTKATCFADAFRLADPMASVKSLPWSLDDLGKVQIRNGEIRLTQSVPAPSRPHCAQHMLVGRTRMG